MPQPVSGWTWQRINGTAAGTTTVGSVPLTLHAILVSVQKTGTASFYDVVGATTSASYMFDIQNTSGTIPIPVVLDLQCKKGLVVVIGGTTDFLIATG